VGGFFALARVPNHGQRLAIGWAALASLVFYGWWDPRYVALLLGSIGFNYTCGIALARRAAAGRPSRSLLAFAVTGNLVLLGFFKYTDFLIGTWNAASGDAVPLVHIVLPLGISFFTFTQIAFLVDAHRGIAREYDFLYYLLFVTWFPHLIAGPVLHHKEMMPQFYDAANLAPRRSNFEVGLTIFFIGLFKKVVLADGIAEYVNPTFSSRDAPTLFDAWSGVLAYTFQLYFDFSGYSDMAIGLSRLFGVKLPLNFASPYQSASIIEFWRRWHMTLSRFLRDYLYFGLGGNRRGPLRRYSNLLVTMVLGGLWHGAGWTFVLWGALHGAYLVLNHSWRAFRSRFAPWLDPDWRIYRLAGVALTFLCVVVGWVFFRAADVDAALRILGGMFGVHGATLPDALGRALGPLRTGVEGLGIAFTPGGGARFVSAWSWIVGLGLVAFFWPNTQALMRRFEPALVTRDEDFSPGAPARVARLAWAPTNRWALVMGLAAATALLSLNRVSEFLYFQF
jgi:D-alanyl-lipoteichoic acid acyltransferase DltB (MBOAT superfamily)